jgi:hypothetical protein
MNGKFKALLNVNTQAEKNLENAFKSSILNRDCDPFTLIIEKTRNAFICKKFSLSEREKGKKIQKRALKRIVFKF